MSPRPERENLTHILRRMAAGDRTAASAALEEVYPELRQRAERLLAREHLAGSMTPSALVNELWLQKLRNLQVELNDRTHFFRLCARGMRQILKDRARLRVTLKRQRDKDVATTMSQFAARPSALEPEDALSIDEALDALGETDPRVVAVVEVKFYLGCTWDETGEHLGIHPSEARRDWDYAQAWLKSRLSSSK